MKRRSLLVPGFTALVLAAGCGDGGSGPSLPVGTDQDVPNDTDRAPLDTDPPPRPGTPNQTDPPPNMSDPAGSGGTSGTPGGADPGCARICDFRAMLGCDDADEAAECLPACTAEVRGEACGTELIALLDCTLSRGSCQPDDDAFAPGGELEACGPAAIALGACFDANDPDPEPNAGPG